MSSGITRRKGQSGRNKGLGCTPCGAKVRDKTIVKRRFGVPLGIRLRKRPLDQGVWLRAGRGITYNYVSCVKHRRYV